MNIDDLVPLRTVRKRIDAAIYNHVRLALMHIANPIRLELPRLRLDLELDRRVWFGYSLVNGTPLLAWTGFEPHRGALHVPIECELRLYHMHAGLLMGSVLDAADAVIAEALQAAARCTAH